MMKNKIAETSTYQNTFQIIKKICLDKSLHNQPMQALRAKSHIFQRGDKNDVKFLRLAVLVQVSMMVNLQIFLVCWH